MPRLVNFLFTLIYIHIQMLLTGPLRVLADFHTLFLTCIGNIHISLTDRFALHGIRMSCLSKDFYF